MTKEQLRNYRAIKREHRQIEQRLRVLEMRPECDQETLLPLRQLYQQKLHELVEALLVIEHAIETLDPVERELVRLRYIDGKDWHQVCACIHYGWTQTHRIHAQVLIKLENM